MTKEKQIEEMARVIGEYYLKDPRSYMLFANHLYNAGYRKQSEGKWISCKNNAGYKCSECGARIKNSAFFTGNHNWCHKCGAKMKGGAE